MATAAQRAWLKRGREQAASTPPTSREYRGPTSEQIKAGTLAVGVPSTAHRKSARTAALTQSGMRAGQTPAQAAAESTKAVYGTKSTQAKQAQATLINEQRIAASRRSVIKDLRGGVISGVKVIQAPHVKTLVDPHIHIRTETLIGKKAADYPTVASQIATMQKNQRRAYLQLTSDASKLQRVQSQLHIAEQRLNKAPIKDGVFVGTEAQYNKYLADYKAYTSKHKEVDTAINKYNSDIRKTEIEGYKLEKLETKTRRAQYGGLVGKYEDIELKVSKKIPTLYDVSRKGAEFRKKHPEAANKLYTTFQKAHAKTEKVGTIEQRNALAGYTYGSYQSIQKQPVKTAAMVAVGMGSVKALSMVGKVGKAYGAGKWSARAAKGIQYGLLAYYGKQSYNHIMSAPNSYEAGQRAAKIMYTEILPIAAGVKAVGAAPKVIKPKVAELKPTVKTSAKIRKLAQSIKKIDTTIKKLNVKKKTKTFKQRQAIDRSISKLLDKRDVLLSKKSLESAKLARARAKKLIEKPKPKETVAEARKRGQKYRKELRKKKAKEARKLKLEKEIKNIKDDLKITEAELRIKKGKKTLIDRKNRLNKLLKDKQKQFEGVIGITKAKKRIKIAKKIVSEKKISVKKETRASIKREIEKLEKKRDNIIRKIQYKRREGKLSKSELDRLNDQIRTYNGRIQSKREAMLSLRKATRAKLTEIELKQQALEGKSTLTNTEMDDIVSSFKPREFGIKKMPVKTVSKFNKLKQDIKYLVPRIKELKLKITRGKGISEKQLTKLQSDLKLSDARLVSKRKELLSIRKQIRSKLTEIELKQRALEAEEYIPLTDANMKSMLDLFKSMKKPKIKDVGKEFRAETAKKEAAVKRGELLEIRQKDGTIALQKVVQKQKQVTKTVTKVKTEVETATKTAQKVKAEVRTATKLKIKTKAQQKTKLRSLIALRITAHANVKSLTNILTQLKVATTEMQKIETAPKTRRKVVASMSTAMKTKASTLTELDIQKRVVMKAIAEQKAAAKQLTRATELVEEIKFKIPPIIPKKKIPTKKKITKKQREVMILKQKNLNAVATFRDLLGSL